MISFGSENGKPSIHVDVRGRYPVYLDNYAIIELAKGDAARRERFVAAIRRRGSLLFSETNVVEIGGPRGTSSVAVRAFLDSLGECWAPLELSPWRVMEKERAGRTHEAALSTEFAVAYFKQRASQYDGTKVVDLSASHFFRLGEVVDACCRNYGQLQRSVDDLYGVFGEHLTRTAKCYEQDPATLDRFFPPLSYSNDHRSEFLYVHLVRLLIREWKACQFTRNDALDFFHAVVGCSTACLATLDRQWKRRVQALPIPHDVIAKVFYRPEIGQLVDCLEKMVAG